MARIQFVNQHYWPETASTGQHLTDLAEHLVSCGHEVRVLCGRARNEDGTAAPRREVENGVEIRRVNGLDGGGALRSRLAGYAAFHLAAGPLLLAQRWADVLVTLTTPPLLGFWGSLARALGGPRHVCFLMDHHPDAEFEAGLVRRTSLLGRVLEAIYGWTLRRADHNVALGPYQLERATQRGVSRERSSIIPIWSRADEIPVLEHAQNELRKRLGWDRRFVVLYSGNAGLVHRFDELLEAMGLLQDTNPDVLFAFVGGGPRRAEIEDHVLAHRLTNAAFHGFIPRTELGALLSAADLHFVSLREEHVGVSVPGKLYGQLASGRPVFFVGPERCETAEDILAAGAGHVFGAGQGPALASALRLLSTNPEARLELGARARAWFLAHRERAGSCEAWRTLLEGIVAGDEHPCPVPADPRLAA